jgi:hypothetical protein
MAKIDKIFKKGYFQIPIYNIDCYMFTSRDDYASAKSAVKADCVDLSGLGGRCCCLDRERDGAVMYYVGIFDGKLSTMVHEITHLALFVLASVGIDPQSSHGEAMCYLVGFLFDTCKEKMDAAG